MKPKHTSGPWQVGFYTQTERIKQLMELEQVAVMCHYDPETKGGALVALAGPKADPQSLIDARLLASSPLLLVAVKLALNEIERDCFRHQSRPGSFRDLEQLGALGSGGIYHEL